MAEVKHVLFRLAFLLIVTPIFSYTLIQCIDDLKVAWKSGNKTKKWFSLTLTLLFLAIALGALQ